MDGEADVDELAWLETLEISDSKKAAAEYGAYLGRHFGDASEANLKALEAIITKYAKVLAKNGDSSGLAQLIKDVRPYLKSISKAKSGKLFRVLLDHFLSLPNAVETQVKVCQECIEWTQEEKHAFLRQALEVRLVSLQLEVGNFRAALAVGQPLLKELKRLDDKALLVEVQLMESRAYYALSNYPKSRAALVSARTTANGIYCPPKLQAALDLQSGILHAQEGDFKTAYSYFYESFEGFDSIDLPVALSGLKYMLLCKIMINESGDVPSIVSGKLALKYSGRELEAMQAVAKAGLNRSLAEFQVVLASFEQELAKDIIIQSHLGELKNTMLEQNLQRILEPFSRIEIDHVAKIIDLPRSVVEPKLSQMILDKKLIGILDQGLGCLELFDAPTSDKTFEAALGVISNTSKVVESLHAKSQKLF